MGERADLRDVVRPAGQGGVDGLQLAADGVVAGYALVDFPSRVSVAGAKLEIAALPFAMRRKRIEFVEDDIVVAAVAKRIGFFDEVGPADHALATRAGAEFQFREGALERVFFRHLRQEDVRADLGIIGFAAANGVDGLNGDTGRLEELGCVGMGGCDVRSEAGALIEPIGLAEFADDPAVGCDVAQDAFAHIPDRGGEFGASLPVGS